MVVTRYQSALSAPQKPEKPAERMLATDGAAQ
jgi:hypothetical protein